MKTKLGIGIGIASCLAYLAGFFGGYIVLVLVAGYVLLCEDNDFLRNAAVKALGVALLFSILPVLLGFIPDVFGLVDNVMSIFGSTERFSYYAVPLKISSIIVFIDNVLAILRKVVMLLLALKALKLQTIKIPIVDDLINRFVPKKEQ